MKTKLRFRTIIIAMLLMITLPATSLAWGPDVVVNPVAGRFYKNVRVSVAFDGTVYIGRLYSVNASGPYQNWEVLKSTDNGATFSYYLGSSLSASSRYTAFDIIAAGNNATNFTLYVARPYLDTVSEKATLRVSKYDINGSSNGVSFDGDNFTYSATRGFEYICWASDSKMASPAGTPYTISLVASKASVRDSLLVWTSANGGTSFIRRALEGTPNYFKSVSAAIGVNKNISQYPRLGIVYEKQISLGDTTGEIWVRYIYADDATDLIYTGPYMVGNAASKNSQPTIAISQTADIATGPGYDDFRTIISYAGVNAGDGYDMNFILTDHQAYAAPDFPVAGTVIGGGVGNQMYPHMVFDPLYKNFILTYYDQQTGKLPYVLKGLSSPGLQTFTSFYQNYRDVTSATAIPIQPRVEMNILRATAIFAWNDEYKCMFEAEGPLEVISLAMNENELKVWPNPASDHVNISFTSISDQSVQLAIYDLSGKEVYSTNSNVIPGENLIKINTSNLSQGQYVLKIASLTKTYPVKLIITE